jgi:hypothetical protein
MKESRFTLHERCPVSRFRLFNVNDDFNRESVTIEVDTSLRSERLGRVFERIEAEHGLPDMLRVDNGPEFMGQVFMDGAKPTACSSITSQCLGRRSPRTGISLAVRLRLDRAGWYRKKVKEKLKTTCRLNLLIIKTTTATSVAVFCCLEI